MRVRLLAWFIACVLGCSSAKPRVEPASCGTCEQVSSSAREPEYDAGTRASLLGLIREARGDGKAPYTPLEGAAQGEVSSFIAARLAGLHPASSQHLTERALDAYGLTMFVAAEGHGTYLVREGRAAPLVVEVPHPFSDFFTLHIGTAIFEEQRARALLVSGAHRSSGCAPEDEDCPADVAHAPTSLFEGVHEGLTKAYPDAIVLQVHGFEERPGDPLVILSAAGTSTELGSVRAALEALLAPLRTPAVALYPVDIDRLGGTTSTQARFLRASGGRMVHLELARGLRERLRADAKLLSSLGRALSPTEGR